MEGTRVTKTVTNQRVGNTAVQEEQVASTPVVDKQEFGLAKMNQFIWYLGHLIAIILALRFVFLLLGANTRGIVAFIKMISSPLVFPFRGIFPAAATGVAYFDPASLLGIIMYYLIVVLITQAVNLFSKRIEV